MANLVFDFLHSYETGERRESEPANAYQYDEGHVLEAVLPEVITSCEIHYWIRGMEDADTYTPTSITPNSDGSCTVLGNIPNSYFETNGELRIYIVVTDGTASITTYEGKLHIAQRAMPDDYVDDDPDNDAVQIIAAARGYAETSEAWAVGQINGEDVPSTADQYQNNASYYANQAASAASSAAAQASLAPAYDNTATYAVGDYCLHDGRLYECTTAITTAEAWTAAHWTAVTVGGELSNLKDDINGSIENLDDGKLKIAPTFVFGTLDTNGDIVPFANNSRCSSVEYYTAKNGDVLTLDASFSMILCEYNASQTLVSRAIKVSGTYALTEGNLYRVCVFDPNGTIQDNPYQFAFKAHLQSKIYKRLDTINADIDAVDKKVSDTADSMIIVPVDPDAVYHNDGYINASTNAVTSIGTSAQYFYSDLISLNKGDVVKVEYRDTLDVVWILSQWTSAGVFVQGVLKGNDIASTVQSYQFTASEDMYIRHSARFLNSLTIKRVNSENAEMFADYLENETEYDYGFLLNSFLKIGGIGDSLASGECISGTQGGVTVANDLYEHSWLQYMARFYGFTGINFSKGGMTTRGWLFDDDYNQQGWTKAQIAENKCNAYIIGLGANDMALMIEDASYLGSPSDIGTTNPTFYRYYAQIISRLKTIQPKAKFFLFTLTWLYTETPPYNAWVDRVNEAITYIANNTENCYLIDLDADRWYYGTDVTGNRRSGHYNAIGYNMQAMHLAKLIGKYIHDHQSEFRQIEFIGTDLSWNN